MVKCFVVGCSTGYKSNKEKTPIFRAPKNDTNFVLWQKSIPRIDRKFSRKGCVCAKHFKEEHINEINIIKPRFEAYSNLFKLCITLFSSSYYTRHSKMPELHDFAALQDLFSWLFALGERYLCAPTKMPWNPPTLLSQSALMAFVYLSC